MPIDHIWPWIHPPPPMGTLDRADEQGLHGDCSGTHLAGRRGHRWGAVSRIRIVGQSQHGAGAWGKAVTRSPHVLAMGTGSWKCGSRVNCFHGACQEAECNC